MKNHPLIATAAILLTVPTLNAASVGDVSVRVNSTANHTFSYRGTTTLAKTYRSSNVPGDRQWGWNGTLTAPGNSWTNANTLEFPAWYFERNLPRPPALTLAIPAGTQKVRVTGTLTANATYLGGKHPFTDNSFLEQFWAGGMSFSEDPWGTPSDLFSSHMLNPVVSLRAANNAWSGSSPATLAYEIRESTTNYLQYPTGTSFSPTPAQRSFAFNHEFTVPSGFSGNVLLTLFGFTAGYTYYWEGSSQGSGFSTYWVTHHIPTSGTLDVTISGGTLAGTVSSSQKLVEGYKGTIPIRFSVTR